MTESREGYGTRPPDVNAVWWVWGTADVGVTDAQSLGGELAAIGDCGRGRTALNVHRAVDLHSVFIRSLMPTARPSDEIEDAAKRQAVVGLMEFLRDELHGSRSLFVSYVIR